LYFPFQSADEIRYKLTYLLVTNIDYHILLTKYYKGKCVITQVKHIKYASTNSTRLYDITGMLKWKQVMQYKLDMEREYLTRWTQNRKTREDNIQRN
jgi:hypothetical protein